MEDTAFDWQDNDYAFNYGTPEVPTPGSPRASPISSAADGADQPSGKHTLPLLRLSGWRRDKHYDKSNPVCIHYDFKWKISQRENIRARHVCSDTDPDLVLAPSDVWKNDFQARLDTILEDNDKFPGGSYLCEETIVEISIERSRQRGLTKRCKNLDIDWLLIDNHLEGLSDLFTKGRKITVTIEFVYKEVTRDSARANGKKKKKSATEAQKLQRAADAGLWTRVYEHYRCRAKHCKQGPHCLVDEQGNHRKLLPRHLEAIVRGIKDNILEGEEEEDVDIDIEIPPNIRKDILDNSRKRKADSALDCRHCKVQKAHGEDTGDVGGDRQGKLEQYCNWGLAQVESDRWRQALQVANQVAIDQFLELNTILQHPKVVVELMVKNKVMPGIALQFVSNIKKFQQEQMEKES